MSEATGPAAATASARRRRPAQHQQAATSVTSGEPQASLPILAIPALLELTRWLEQRHKVLSGGAPCPSTGPEQSPPARTTRSASPLDNSTLGAAPAVPAASSTPGTQPHGRAAAPRPSVRE